MSTDSAKRNPQKTIGHRVSAAPACQILRTRTFAIVAALAVAVITLIVHYGSTRKTPDTIAGSSASFPTNAQRFIGGADDGYVDAAACATCHDEIAASYSQTGMARAFSRAQPKNMVEDFNKTNTYFHAPSGDQYTMVRRGAQYYQRRSQLDPEGKEVNVFERQIHYVMGSGNHARTYLNIDSAGKLTQLPLGWYAEKGGFWAMSPNYDNPQHMGFQREIGFGCMFCHNGYPEMAPGEDAQGREPRYRGRIPEGIDCQRCHGPGRNHIEALRSGASVEKARAAIVNPRRLDSARQLEICMQCHLETTTRSLPHEIVRFDRNVFSFRPGEPLANYALHFDYAPGRGPKDPFEIAHTVYRLRQSACFLSTAGKPQAMTCTTCHDPHQALRGEAASTHYQAVCRKCHAAEFNALVASRRHTSSVDCTTCHMPKRRTDDVIHVVMTDHYIQRRKPPRDLLVHLAEQPETEATRYRGEVALYYPPELPQTDETELYLATAQVVDASNLELGIPKLRRAIERVRPTQAGFYFHLAEAYREANQEEKALPLYEAVLDSTPKHRDAWLNYSVALGKAGRVEQAIKALGHALEQLPDDPRLLSNLGELYLGNQFATTGGPLKAIGILRRAVEIDPAHLAAQQNLGLAYAATGEIDQAMRAWQEALRIQPFYALAHNSLGVALAERDKFAEAATHFRQALRSDGSYVNAHFNYATLLFRMGRLAEAQAELRDVIRLDPNYAVAYSNLADLLRQQGNMPGAIKQYRLALAKDPTLERPHLGLGMALASQGDFPVARTEFEAAAKSTDPELRSAAKDALKKLRALGRH